MSAETELLAFLDEREEELVEFTRELIATPSVNPPGDERAVVELTARKLRELGVDNIEILADKDSRPNLFASISGSEVGPSLILCSHLDTKPPGELEPWRFDPWDPVIEGGELYGLGSGDMKASAAAMVYAGAALQHVGLPAGGVTLALVADEEAGSAYGAKWLANAGHLKADAALIGEPCGVTKPWEAINLVSRGAALFKIKVFGTQMHSSISDRLPSVNATVHAARLIDLMHRELKGALTYDQHPLCKQGPTVNIGVTASAGVFYGVYPGDAEFGCDIRTIPGMTRAQLIADIEAFLAAAMAEEPELRAELHFEDIYYEPTEIKPDAPIARAVQAAAETVLGQSLPFEAFPGATDAAHIQGAAGIPTIAAFGPGFLPRAHGPNESVPVDDIGLGAKMFALAALRFVAG